MVIVELLYGVVGLFGTGVGENTDLATLAGDLRPHGCQHDRNDGSNSYILGFLVMTMVFLYVISCWRVSIRCRLRSHQDIYVLIVFAFTCAYLVVR